MNAQAHYARMLSREVSERKQVGDMESLFHSEKRRREEEQICSTKNAKMSSQVGLQYHRIACDSRVISQR
ncbi:unnamed protein product [Penicillium camemberti]|uniref:Str. FM013 n=1 Tax=Penicillium camemberti (strain FM 013) TaxID=1429867 RepID=A0A0G4P5L0_PENC3|nr:unnamed protein product [Penicillium camemberti]